VTVGRWWDETVTASRRANAFLRATLGRVRHDKWGDPNGRRRGQRVQRWRQEASSPRPSSPAVRQHPPLGFLAAGQLLNTASRRRLCTTPVAASVIDEAAEHLAAAAAACNTTDSAGRAARTFDTDAVRVLLRDHRGCGKPLLRLPRSAAHGRQPPRWAGAP